MGLENKDFTSQEELSSYLKSHGINPDNWGVGGTRTIKHLLNELQSSECRLEEINGRLIRHVIGVGINVFYKDGETILRLDEDRQVFTTGQQRRRNIITSLGEKMYPDEKPEDAAVRALKEELQLSDYSFGVPQIEDRAPTPSKAYPGLITRHLVYLFDVLLKSEDYKPCGYQEVQPDKTTHFVWQKIG
jgi:8-oxo-dGTP pyrophosphatase MutT (NUDIX family)